MKRTGRNPPPRHVLPPAYTVAHKRSWDGTDGCRTNTDESATPLQNRSQKAPAVKRGMNGPSPLPVSRHWARRATWTVAVDSASWPCGLPSPKPYASVRAVPSGANVSH
jgi:hypothetical protein